MKGFAERPYIWGGVVMIVLGVFLWIYGGEKHRWADASLILIGVVVWLYGDRKAGAI